MPFAIELLFDPQAEKAVRHFGNILEKNHIPSTLTPAGAGPHLSIAGFKAKRKAPLQTLLKKTSGQTIRFSFQFSGVGVFKAEGVLFLKPVITPKLLKIHAQLHDAIKDKVGGDNVHYFPKSWIPHCTLAMGLTSAQLKKAVKLLKGLKPRVKGVYRRLALVEFYPVKEVFSFPLKSPKPRP
jgi:2'-5' RNA ligase